METFFKQSQKKVTIKIKCVIKSKCMLVLYVAFVDYCCCCQIKIDIYASTNWQWQKMNVFRSHTASICVCDWCEMFASLQSFGDKMVFCYCCCYHFVFCYLFCQFIKTICFRPIFDMYYYTLCMAVCAYIWMEKLNEWLVVSAHAFDFSMYSKFSIGR